MRIPRLLISALRGGAGKTLLSLGLARVLVQAGFMVKPYKKGPDYIDAAWLARAAGTPCTNLDPFFLEPDRLCALFCESFKGISKNRFFCFPAASNALFAPVEYQQSTLLPQKSTFSLPEKQNSAVFRNTLKKEWIGGKRLALIEGNRGLFDGRDVSGSCSSAQVARVLDAPVLLSLDITKMTRTAAAVVDGLARFEPGVRIAGVVLNQVASSRHEAIVRASIEAHTDVPVLGALPRMKDNPLPERRMGLTGDGSDAEDVLQRLGAFIAQYVDIARVVNIANDTQPVQANTPFWPEPAPSATSFPRRRESSQNTPSVHTSIAPPVRIGYVRDAALWFYYAENLEALEHAGATLVPLSVLDATPWPPIDGLYLGGGFPEEYAELMADAGQLAHICALSEAGLPIYAECGGLITLTAGIVRESARLKMAGVFPLWVQCHTKPQGLGYVDALVIRDTPFHPQGTRFRGHEFHYSHLVDAPADAACLHLAPGTGMGNGRDGLCVRNTFAAYTHIYAPAAPHWATKFVALCRAQKGALLPSLSF